MTQYCDTTVLEKNWFEWLLASATPNLEEYRKMGLLWTKPLGVVMGDNGPARKAGKMILDPRYGVRLHCLATANPLFFISVDGECGDCILQSDKRVLKLDVVEKMLHLASNSPIHDGVENLGQQSTIIPQLVQQEYIREQPTNTLWHLMVADLHLMCVKIGINFRQKTEEEHLDLAHEALLQVIRKIVRGKLVYIPGKAPVFNLLTTTIHRCMYSIMNKSNKSKSNLSQLLSDAQNGALVSQNRSMRY